MGSFSKRYYKKGVAEGELKGKAESMRKVAAGMLGENLPVEIISKVTGMSSEGSLKIKKARVKSA